MFTEFNFSLCIGNLTNASLRVLCQGYEEWGWEEALPHNSIFLGFAAAVLILIIITAVIGNGLVVYALLVESRLRTVTNFFILNLALADLTTTCFVMTFEVDTYFKDFRWDHGPVMCDIWKTLYLFSTPASIINLCAVSVDRYLLLSYPLRYDFIVTPARVGIIMGMIWVYALVMALLPVMGWRIELLPGSMDIETDCIFTATTRYNVLMSILNYVLPPVTMCILWIKIYLIARDHANRMAILKPSLLTSEDKTRNSSREDTTQNCLKEKSSTNVTYRKKVKGSRYIAFIVVVFFLCWLPYSLLSIIGNFWLDIHYFVVPPEVYTSLLLLGYANSALNPLLYGLQDRGFQKVYRRVWRYFSC